MEHTADRQRLLRYGIVIHAMVDTLDPDHDITRDRPSYPHKLSKKSRRDLKYRVFHVYLKFVDKHRKVFRAAWETALKGKMAVL